ncbi:H-NS histone family protein [Burkholderia arboris]|uniref:H-NS histone family protein n=1 Tax=Burkholderia arboris TaxID=488730 RepID=UPI001CF41BDD|nr:H-NS histone family protein [Burkholderia arboris]MCA8050251.1 H-NS histone family protein [Burkholderia arboris]
MATYLELKSQVEQLRQQAEQARLAELEIVLAEVQARVAEYGLTPEQVFGHRCKTSRMRVGQSSVPARYRDPRTGATWSGRGREPGWIKGKKRERFLIEQE